MFSYTLSQVLSSGQNTAHLLPHLLLVLGMLCQVVECPALATGGGVVTLKRERVHLFPDLQVAQIHPVPQKRGPMMIVILCTYNMCRCTVLYDKP